MRVCSTSIWRRGCFTRGQALSYLSECLRILSGFYGLLKPFDGLVWPYRLEMQARLSVNGVQRSVEFWAGAFIASDERGPGDRQPGPIVLTNPARIFAVHREIHKTPEDRFITVEFGEAVDGKVKAELGTLAKDWPGRNGAFSGGEQYSAGGGMKEFHALG